MADLECDVAIIGAGTAGLAAERTARRAGARTLLIDPTFRGTTCATVGCMPSKLLIAAGEAAHAVRQSSLFGIGASAPRVDGRAVMARVQAMRDAFVDSTKESFGDLPEGVAVRASARFVDATTLATDGGRKVRAKAVVIATGSRPSVPEMFADLGERLLTNETIFDLETLPVSVAVIGAGPLGLELAQALARLDVEVCVFDRGDTLGGVEDADVGAALKTVFAREMALHLGVKIKAVRDGDGVMLSWTGASEGAQRYERVLVAAGRPPNLKGLDLEKTGLELDGHGTPKIDPATMQCGGAPIFMAGDADAKRPVLHEASSEGAIAGRNAARYPEVTPSKRAPSFAIMFTDPPLAVVGEPAGDGSVIGCASYEDQGRAKIEAKNVGLVRIYADPAEGRLTGATLAGPGMDHVGHLFALAIMRGETATSLLEMPFYHPTIEEGLRPALRAICAAVHAPVPADQDEGTPPGA